jgi:hypothetical protein
MKPNNEVQLKSFLQSISITHPAAISFLSTRNYVPFFPKIKLQQETPPLAFNPPDHRNISAYMTVKNHQSLSSVAQTVTQSAPYNTTVGF